MHSNCLFFAVALYLRRAKRGDVGYIVMRRSRYGRFPHFLFLHRGRRLISYVPNNPRLKSFPPPVFRGHVKFGDHH
jgi:hypothetical protein